MSSGKCKLQQRDTTILLLEWPKTKTLRTVYTDKDGEQHEFSCIAGRNTKWYRHFGRQLAIVYKTKHTLTTRSSNHTPWYLPKGYENLYLHNSLHIDVYTFITAKTWKQLNILQ